MEQSELLRFAIEALERLGLRYFVTGSVASIYFGEPRFTNDIDIVVDLEQGGIAEFCREFPADEFHIFLRSLLDVAQGPQPLEGLGGLGIDFR